MDLLLKYDSSKVRGNKVTFEAARLAYLRRSMHKVVEVFGHDLWLSMQEEACRRRCSTDFFTTWFGAAPCVPLKLLVQVARQLARLCSFAHEPLI